MCLPMRRTVAMRLCSSAAAISRAGDFSGSGFSPSQIDSITSPDTRLASPRAMVSTSGSSGMPHQCTRAPGWEWDGVICSALGSARPVCRPVYRSFRLRRVNPSAARQFCRRGRRWRLSADPHWPGVRSSPVHSSTPRGRWRQSTSVRLWSAAPGGRMAGALAARVAQPSN